MKLLKTLAKSISKEKPKSGDDYRNIIEKHCEDIKIKTKSAFMLIRVAVMKNKESLPLFEVLEFCGVDLNVRRLKEAAAFVNSIKE